MDDELNFCYTNSLPQLRAIMQIGNPKNKYYKKQNEEGWYCAKLQKVLEAELYKKDIILSEKAVKLFIEKMKQLKIIIKDEYKTGNYNDRHRTNKEIFVIDYKHADELIKQSELLYIIDDNFYIQDVDIKLGFFKNK